MPRSRPALGPTLWNPCRWCGKQHRPDLSDADHTETQFRAYIRWAAMEAKGEFQPPLPSEEQRRHIRDRAGWTQQDVADEIVDRWGLNVSRDLVCRWEKRCGYVGDYRLPGREPSGAKRRAYAALLEELKRMPPAATKQPGRL